MLANKATKAGSLIFLIGLSAGYCGLFFSSFLSSLGTALMFISVFFNSEGVKTLDRRIVVLYFIPFLLVLLDYFRTTNYTVVSAKLLLMLGFALIALSCFVNKQTIIKYQRQIGLFALVILLLINLASVTNYFINKAELDKLLLQSKSIPVFGGMHHIHFGIMNALAIVLCVHHIIFKKLKTNKYYIGIALIILLFSFHILSSRTGLVSLYLALSAVLVLYAFKEKSIVKAALGLSLVVIVNFAAFSLSSSFKNKLTNSIEDIDSWDEAEEVNFKSMGMRLEAYRIGLELFKDNPLVGVGSGEMENQLQEYYVKHNTALYKENRIGPHNQFLEYAIKYGLIGFLFVLIFFAFWTFKAFRPMNYGLLTIVLVLLIACQFESLLERQVSLFVTATVLPISLICLSKEN